MASLSELRDFCGKEIHRKCIYTPGMHVFYFDRFHFCPNG